MPPVYFPQNGSHFEWARLSLPSLPQIIAHAQSFFSPAHKVVAVIVTWACTFCWLSIAHYCLILHVMHTQPHSNILLPRFEYQIEIVMYYWPIHYLWWMMRIIKFAIAQHRLLWEINQNIKQIRNKHYISLLRLQNVKVLHVLLFPDPSIDTNIDVSKSL